MPAIFFGSIGSLVETSEMQRASYNEAFSEHSLDWHWGLKEYQSMLEQSGGADRIQLYARLRSQQVDVAKIHNAKTRIFQRKLLDDPVEARPGCIATLKQARENGFKTGLVTSTSACNVNAILQMVPELNSGMFDFVIDRSHVEKPKPMPECYTVAVNKSQCYKEQCVAIEDNHDGLMAAVGAGVTTIAFPGTNTRDHDYKSAEVVTDWLHFDLVQDLVG